MSTFESFNFAGAVAENLKRHGFVTPTPIQAQAIPAVIEGRDVVGIAQTGTGKTAAFVLPMLHKLSSGPRRHVRALIVGPTRELAEQINEVVHQLGRGTQLHTALIFGGVSYRPQFDAIRRGAEIVVACPGRLLDHIRQGSIRLDRVEMLVLDEADQMFDMGFLPDIKEIIKCVAAQRQTLLFSATMPPEIRKLAHQILHDPVEIKLAHAPVETVSHAVFPCKQEDKAAVVVELLRRTDAGPVLIFTRTRHRTTKLAATLCKSGFRAAAIEGGLSQAKRKHAMDGFRTGRFQILVATDVAARGIDVSGISHVINFDMPDTIEAYTHRIGRTGRAAKTGDAYTLVTREDTQMVRHIERALRAPIERRYLEGFDPRAASQNQGRPHGGHEGERHREPTHAAPGPRIHHEKKIHPAEPAPDAAPATAPQEPPPPAALQTEPAHEPRHEPRHEERPRAHHDQPRREFHRDDRGPRNFDKGPRKFENGPRKFQGGPRKFGGPPRHFGDRPPRQFDDRGPRRPDDREPRRFDDRPPRRFDDRPPRRFDEAPREGGQERPPFRKEFGGPGFGKKPFEKKPFGAKFGKKPFGSKFEKRDPGGYRKHNPHRKGRPGDEPTMTGAPRHQNPGAKKPPFWERFAKQPPPSARDTE